MQALSSRCLRFAALGFALVARAAAAESAPAAPSQQRIAFPDARFTVSGLAWFAETSPTLRRLPERMKSAVPPKVWALAGAPSGARIRFITDSATVGIVGRSVGDAAPPAHMPVIAYAGIDLYADGVYFGSVAPDAQGAIRRQWNLGTESKPREITFYLPAGRSAEVREILLAPAATFQPPRPFALGKPVVYYGSSITQGMGVSNPGLIYQAQLARWTNTDFINLGFSGNGFGEPALAEAVAEIDAACFVIDYWANPSTAIYRKTLPGFIDIIRQKHPRTPIIVTGPYYNPSEETLGQAGTFQIEKRVVAREFVAARQLAGDQQIFHVDGLEMLSRAQSDGLADGRHANSLGYYFCAKGLEPHVRRALGLPPVSDSKN